MSTRAILNLKSEDGRTLRLYCAHDGYVCGGLGEYLFVFCKKQQMGMTSAEVLYDLLLDNDFALETFGEDEILDYVYEIDCSATQSPRLVCWHVDWSGNNHRPLVERLIKIDVEAEINKKLDKDDSWPGLFPCPYCGKAPGIAWSSRKGTSVSCNDNHCKGSSLIGWFTVAHDAEIAWNEQCQKIHPLK